jgi:MGT family glycosyltransferase
MSRVLITVPPLAGHVNPTIGLGAELSRRGHDVAWAGLPGVVDALLGPGARFLPLVGTLDQGAFDDMRQRGSGLRGPEALRFLWRDFIIPYAAATAAELADLVRDFDPALMVVDQQAVAGAVVARRLGLPWVTSATTSAELTDPLAGLPKVADWVRAQLLDLQLELGVSAETASTGDLRFSDELIVAFTTPALAGQTSVPEGSRISFVGPSIAPRAGSAAFPWEWLDPGLPHVLVTLGTVNASIGARFFAVAVEALASLPVQAVVVAPGPQVQVPPHVDNVLVRASIPQLAVLEHMDAVITHGGHNTVSESLACGLPLVLAPIRDDQPIVADQVVRAGAGIRVRFGRVGAAELGAAVRRVLDDSSYRDAAAAIRHSFAQAGGAAAAADAVGALLMACPSRV